MSIRGSYEMVLAQALEQNLVVKALKSIWYVSLLTSNSSAVRQYATLCTPPAHDQKKLRETRLSRDYMICTASSQGIGGFSAESHMCAS